MMNDRRLTMDSVIFQTKKTEFARTRFSIFLFKNTYKTIGR